MALAHGIPQLSRGPGPGLVILSLDSPKRCWLLETLEALKPCSNKGGTDEVVSTRNASGLLMKPCEWISSPPCYTREIRMATKNNWQGDLSSLAVPDAPGDGLV